MKIPPVGAEFYFMRTDRRTGRYDDADSRFYNYAKLPKNQICHFAIYEVMGGNGFIRPHIYGVSNRPYRFNLEERISST
jgi:hypothetical protein